MAQLYSKRDDKRRSLPLEGGQTAYRDFWGIITYSPILGYIASVSASDPKRDYNKSNRARFNSRDRSNFKRSKAALLL